MKRARSWLRGRGPCQRAKRACATSESASRERVSRRSRRLG